MSWAETHPAIIFSSVNEPVSTFNITIRQNYQIAIIQDSGLGADQNEIRGAGRVLERQAALSAAYRRRRFPWVGRREKNKDTYFPLKMRLHSAISEHMARLRNEPSKSSNETWITLIKSFLWKSLTKTKISIFRMLWSINERTTFILKEKL